MEIAMVTKIMNQIRLDDWMIGWVDDWRIGGLEEWMNG
jgi:hypothetical protein